MGRIHRAPTTAAALTAAGRTVRFQWRTIRLRTLLTTTERRLWMVVWMELRRTRKREACRRIPQRHKCPRVRRRRHPRIPRPPPSSRRCSLECARVLPQIDAEVAASDTTVSAHVERSVHSRGHLIPVETSLKRSRNHISDTALKAQCSYIYTLSESTTQSTYCGTMRVSIFSPEFGSCSST